MTARFDGLNKMRNTLAVQFERILMEVEQRMSLRALLVERKLKHLAQALEAREAQIMQLVIALEGDPASVDQARKHLENLLHKKNDVIDELQYEVMRMGKAYNELWSTCQRKLVEEMNSPVNLGIVPVTVNINLTSPFNPATAIGSRISNKVQQSESLINLGPPNDGLPKMGRGPAGMASVAPF
ncbi:Growth arrest-specific protein 8 [Fasciola hepatica]|uniref:Dynein regulatory complex subunit 4 n=1 Tax=Fasciola hepatica TaxID=6192 RepID=A0A4E0RW44_FASHE|nr:Growth arrest-specific protein 8 [Fasciola hepatica]